MAGGNFLDWIPFFFRDIGMGDIFMSKYSFKDDYESIHIVIKSLSKNPKLNDYEKGFIKNMNEYVINNHGFMSGPQLTFLSNLWEKY